MRRFSLISHQIVWQLLQWPALQPVFFWQRLHFAQAGFKGFVVLFYKAVMWSLTSVNVHEMVVCHCWLKH